MTELSTPLPEDIDNFLNEEEKRQAINDKLRLYILRKTEKSVKAGNEIEGEINKEIQVLAQLRNQAVMYLATKERGKATEIIVKYILKNNFIYTTKEDEKPQMWVYENGIYTPNGNSFVKEITRKILGDAFTSHLCSDIINKIEADTYIAPEKFFSKSYKDEVPVMNGILNIYSRTLSPFTPEKIFFNKCPVYYDPKAKCETIDSFLSDILPNVEDKNVFYEIGGYCLMKEYQFEKAFMFVGNGRNGKGKSLEL